MSNDLNEALQRLGVFNQQAVAIGDSWMRGDANSYVVHSPIDGQPIAEFSLASPQQVSDAIDAATNAFQHWRTVPAPVRGNFVREFGNLLRAHKTDLATVVTYEAGKIVQESLGEVQEMIDICDFAVGLSRQLYGRSIASERPNHRLAEQWHPLGPIGVISAFNFPVAVWAWNAAVAFVCGDPVVWKPSEKTSLCAMACQSLLMQVAKKHGVPSAVSSIVIGGVDAGQALASDSRLPLISATGSIPMGRAVATTVAERLGRSLLELGGNNAMVVTPSADLELAIRAIVFSAVGTCGQRCTSLRRLIIHESIADSVVARLTDVYRRLPIGDPRDELTLIGPLIDGRSRDTMAAALKAAVQQDGRVVYGGDAVTGDSIPDGGVYVQPAIVEIDAHADIVQQETFAPILYVIRYSDLADAIAIQNNVPQGLASAIFTSNVREAELFCSASGSDCGIVNVNIGTSGAEIGGAFGGEKETGGGRESGSDSWKAYMRRATNTINYSTELPLAQGIKFDV
ncbi:MAG: aldehyde dehydrogenase family protein [Planctomycetales bacterium]|nr:aldehyde dehydrogenase family protein [Planctomycetales bacterium]